MTGQHATPTPGAKMIHLIKCRPEAGVTHCIFGLKAAPADDVLHRLDRLVAFLEHVR